MSFEFVNTTPADGDTETVLGVEYVYKASSGWERSSSYAGTPPYELVRDDIDNATSVKGLVSGAQLAGLSSEAILGWWDSSTSKTKLDGIATGATKNATDAQLRDRSTHTGTQPHTTITGLSDAATTTVASIRSGTTAANVGLGDVDNTSDLNKPISAATQAALATKASSSHTHSWSQVTGQPATATRWPTFGEVSGKPSSFTPSPHTHPSSQITGLGTAATKNVGTGTDDIQTNSQNRSEFAAKSGGAFTTDIIVNELTVGSGGGNSAGNAVIGKFALRDNTTGFFNTACGYEALINNITGYRNTGIGRYALGGNTIFNNCSGFGYNAQVTGLNQVQLGDSATTTYAYGPVQNRSDIRDKADVRDTALGLDFINALRPVDFRWDMREDYRPDMPEKSEDESDEAFKSRMDEWHEFVKMANITTDGTHKRSRYHHGLIAQEVKSVIDTAGIDFGGFQDHKLSGGDDVLSLGYEELIAPLIKAVQELTARIDILESKEQP